MDHRALMWDFSLSPVFFIFKIKDFYLLKRSNIFTCFKNQKLYKYAQWKLSPLTSICPIIPVINLFSHSLFIMIYYTPRKVRSNLHNSMIYHKELLVSPPHRWKNSGRLAAAWKYPPCSFESITTAPFSPKVSLSWLLTL